MRTLKPEHVAQFKKTKDKDALQYVKRLGYDSVAEFRFHAHYPHLERCVGYYYGTDGDAIEFKNPYDQDHKGNCGTFYAKPDFYCPVTKTYFEVKASDLNKKAAPYLCSDRKPYHKHGWNHSAVKQGLVAKQLADMGINFMLVFEQRYWRPRTLSDYLSFVAGGARYLKSMLASLIHDTDGIKAIKQSNVISKNTIKYLEDNNVPWCYEKDLPNWFPIIGDMSPYGGGWNDETDKTEDEYLTQK